MEVDFVITYVDSEDAEWQKKYNSHKSECNEVCGNKRFRNTSFLKYVLRSIDKGCEFVNRVFLVVQSYSQVPLWIDTKNVRIVLHEEFIPKEFLPTFNSTTIELFLHKIPELSEKFVYFNDDMLINSKLTHNDFFFNNKLNICSNTINFNDKKGTYYNNCYNNVKCIDRVLNCEKGDDSFNIFTHTCIPLFKSVCDECFKKIKDEIYNRITRFRDIKNLNHHIYAYYAEKMGYSNKKTITVKYVDITKTPIKQIGATNEHKTVCFNDNIKNDSNIDKKHELYTSFLERRLSQVSKYERIITIPTNFKIAVCVISKNEDKYLIEWIKYYVNAGFDKIIFYDNNDINDNTQYNLIKPYIDNGIVIYNDYRGNIDFQQYRAYQDCYDRYGSQYQWIAFLSVDEFITSNTTKTLKQILSTEKKYWYYDCIIVNRIYMSNKNEELSDIRNSFKCIVKGGVENVNFIATFSKTKKIPVEKYICDNEGNTFENKRGYTRHKNGFYIKHYEGRSIEEFIHKLKRGFANTNLFQQHLINLIEEKILRYQKANGLNEYEKDMIISSFPDLELDVSLFGKTPNIDYKIDYVFPYVDFNDPIWKREYEKFYKGSNFNNDSCNGADRFISYDLLKYKFRSIEKNMPWVNNVFMIVSNSSQIPKWLNTNKVKIVYHKDIIPQELLPTFNSTTIEMFLGNIDGLSEHFIYGNDDMYINKKIEPYMFFRNGNPLITMVERNTKIPEKMGGMPLMTNNILSNCMKLSGFNDTFNIDNRIFQPNHHIKPMIKSLWQKILKNNYDEIISRCTKFRENKNLTQYLIFYYMMINHMYMQYKLDAIALIYGDNKEKNLLATKIVSKNKKLFSLDFHGSLNENEVKLFDDCLNNIFPEKSIYEVDPPKVGVCAIGKWEEQYLTEWVEHYKKLGFDNIIFYDNNDDDKQFKLLKPYIDEGFVIYNDYREKVGSKIQRKAYTHCLNNNKKNFDWIAFFDMDEFLILQKHNNIKEFLTHNLKYQKYSGISLNWLNYTDSGNIYNDSRPLNERFTTPKKNRRTAIKTIVNTNNCRNQCGSVHTFDTYTKLCDEDGESFIISANPAPYKKYKGKIAYIKHYRTKTIEEFIKKVKRGYINGKHCTFNEDTVNMFKKQFFGINEMTKEKIDLFNDAFADLLEK